MYCTGTPSRGLDSPPESGVQRSAAASRGARRDWGGSALSVLDQGVNSLGNFVMTMVMARALTLRDFGIYSLLFAAMMTVNGLVNTVIAEPVRTLGVSRPPHLQRQYAGAVLCAALLAAALAASALSLYLTLGTRAGAAGAAAVGAAILVTGVFEVTRALGAARLRWLTVLLGDCALQAAKLVTLGALFAAGRLELIAAYWILAGAGCLGLAVMWFLGIRPSAPSRDYLFAQARTHFAFGKWLSLESGVYLLSTQLYLYLIALLGNVAAAGAFSAVQTLVNAVNALWMGITTFSTSAAREILLREGTHAWRRWLRNTAAGLGASVALLLSAISLWSPQLLGLLFAPAFARYSYLAPLLSGAAVLAVINSMLNVAFRCIDMPQIGFRGKALSAVVTTAICVPLVSGFGVAGAAAGLIVTQACWLAVYLWSARAASGDLNERVARIRSGYGHAGSEI